MEGRTKGWGKGGKRENEEGRGNGGVGGNSALLVGGIDAPERCSLAFFKLFPFTSSDNLPLGSGLGSVLIAGLTSTFRTPQSLFHNG